MNSINKSRLLLIAASMAGLLAGDNALRGGGSSPARKRSQKNRKPGFKARPKKRSK